MRRLALLCLIPLAACSLTGGGSTGVGFDDLRDGLSESETLSKHHGSQWRCGPTSDQFNHLGDKVCGAENIPFNGLQASNVAYFFRGDKLGSATIEFGSLGFDAVAKAMDDGHKRTAESQGDHMAWAVKDGTVYGRPEARRNGHSFVIWESAAEEARAE